MQQAYINAFLKVCPKIYGRQLLPFSLGHCFLLDMLESPFIHGGKIVLDDLVLASFICSKSFEENIYLLENQNQFAVMVAEWGRLGADNISSEKQPKPFEYQRELEIFQAYIGFYSVFPRRTPETITAEQRIPWQVKLAWKLLGKFSEKEIYDMPLPKAITYYTACIDWEILGGDKSLLSEGAIEFLEANEQTEQTEATEEREQTEQAEMNEE